VQAAAAPYTVTEPDPARAARYNDLYPSYVGLYPALKHL
jgi:sugar (pentulose or hexulose) kinase